MKRELHSGVSAEAGLGSLVLAGGVEISDGASLSAPAAFDRAELYEVSLALDEKPVRVGVPGTSAPAAPRPDAAPMHENDTTAFQTRDAVVTIKSRANQHAQGEVALGLPDGWTVEGGAPWLRVALPFARETRGVRYRIRVPPNARPGAYPIRITLQADERSYTAGGTLIVSPRPAEGAADTVAPKPPSGS